jgi:GT2 family glycosyltransferase
MGWLCHVSRSGQSQSCNAALDTAAMIDTAKIGIVIIGRNEGERLKRCLESLKQQVLMVYVDSGSQDGSVEYVKAQGVAAIALSSDKPFSAARARNAGIDHLLSHHPDLEFVQTVDGDCVIDPLWLSHAAPLLADSQKVSTVFGRLRERYPDRSIYNRLCDAEWDVPLGEVDSCGGNALHRIVAIKQVGGFQEGLIAGEEPDLCLRLKQAGWRILRIVDEMGEHDAAITRFGQWWRRAVRAGHAYAEHVWRHRSESFTSWQKQLWRILLWAFVLPLSSILLIQVFGFQCVAWISPLLIYPLQYFRLWFRERTMGADGGKIAGLTLIGKFAEAQGVITFLWRLVRGKGPVLIEYKLP